MNKNIKMCKVNRDSWTEETYLDIMDKKDKEIEALNTKILDLTYEVIRSKETELIEFLRELYISCKEELELTKDRWIEETKSSKVILDNLINYIQDFAKTNKIKL